MTMKLQRKAGGKKKQLFSLKNYQELVLNERTIGRKLAHHILRAWGATMEESQVNSVVDLAVCEAAVKFDRKRKVKFSTYLFYYLKGALKREIAFEAAVTPMPIDDHSIFDGIEQARKKGDSRHYADPALYINDSSNPERDTHKTQCRQACLQALSKLGALEKQVMEATCILDLKVTAVARNLGYSRGYISDVKTQGKRKLRKMLEAFKEAA